MKELFMVLLISVAMITIFNSQIATAGADQNSQSSNIRNTPTEITRKPVVLTQPRIFVQRQRFNNRLQVLTPRERQRIISNLSPWKERTIENSER